MSNGSISNVEVNTDDVLAFLQGASLKGFKKMKLTVGYKAEHAVFVHEDTSANHPNGGQAKYLEQPARDTSVIDRMRDEVRKALKNKKGLREGLINAGNVLLRASMPLVPVDTGELRDSGFVEIEDL